MNELTKAKLKRVRIARILGIGLLNLLLAFSLGNRACYSTANKVPCGDLDVSLGPGECKVIPNPCSAVGEWNNFELDGIRLDPTSETMRAAIAAEQMQLKSVRNGDEVVRSLCVGDNAPRLPPTDIGFFYAAGNSWSSGVFHLRVTNGMSVVATATPASIALGETSQLLASPSGGIGPYTYIWTNESLDNPFSQAPQASPHTTTTYTVLVFDSSGKDVSGTVKLVVRPQLSVTAAPELITPGQPVQLTAVALGGSGSYTYSWTPVDTLNDPHEAMPIARPVTTTTYNVVVTDSAGLVVDGSVTVTVTPLTPLTASFTYRIGAGQNLILDANASTGNIASYIWELSWTSTSPDLVTTSPVASIPVRETDFGTITLTVVDSAGNRATTSLPF